MESELHMQLDLSNRAPLLDDDIPPQALSELLYESSLFQLNPQVESLIGLPMFPSLITENNGLENDAINSVLPFQQDLPSESLNAVISGSSSYDYTPSIPPSLNCGIDGLLSDVNGKWDQNRFLSQPELNCGTSTSGFELIHLNDNQDINEWVISNSMNVGSSHPYGTSSSNNEFCLDITTSRPSQTQTRSSLECGSRGNARFSFGFASNSRSPKFTTIISGSKFLGVLHQILSEITSYSQESIDQRSYSTSLVSSSRFVDPRISFDDGGDEFLEDDGSFEARAESSYRRLELESKKSQLLGMLQMVDDRYNQCLDEINSVTSALHAASELDPQIHASFALRTVSLFYKNLRERIGNQILAMGDSGSAKEKERCLEKSFIQKQWALQQLKRRDQQLWRPQRGLPERSVSVLRAWMFDNFLHPYPKDSDKHLLAIKSGLTRSQVSNWFINARVRLWKPLVEEMSAELNRRKGSRKNEERTNKSNNQQNQLTIFRGSNQRFNT